MNFISIDLGTTNIKVAVYDHGLKELALESKAVVYFRDGNMIEFNPADYFSKIEETISRCCRQAFQTGPYSIDQIILTGQAESLIVVDEDMKPLRNGISWLDMRSTEECEELKKRFDADTCYRITGQPEIIPTWPITKILWLRKHEPAIFKKASKYLLLKDYIQYRLTGKLYGEFSIYNFSHYFDISRKTYWTDILDHCGISINQLPPLIEPCTVIGNITKEVAEKLNMDPSARVNVGTLDHFSGMVGTGNIQPGIISESTGTVLSIATMVEKPVFSEDRVACHYGPFKDSYVLLPVCESGGICLEWFKEQFLQDESYTTINEVIGNRELPNELIFLPYITGANAPDFNSAARGVFYGIQLKHDKYDFAYAVMEGITHLLKINIDHIEKAGYRVDRIISTGGGAKSDLWSQLKANITGYEVAIPLNAEAACLGAAMIGAVSAGVFSTYPQAIDQCISIKKQFTPQNRDPYLKKNELFRDLYERIFLQS